MSAMRISLTVAACAIAFGSVPDQDARNNTTPNTDTHFTMPAYRTLDEWRTRKQSLRTQILSAAGLWPMPPRTPLNPHIFGKLERDGYSIEKVYMESLPGYFLGGNLYRPAGQRERHPAVLIAQGHWDYGRLENQPLSSTPSQGATMARQGYVVFAYDMVGYNDMVQTPHKFGEPRDQLWAFGPLGLQLWNSTRVLDFVTSLEDVDAGRIAMTGASGGGTQTFLLAAVDDRIGFAAPVNMVSAIMQGGCTCENAPGLRVGTSNLEFAAMIAPRPMMLVSGPKDWTKNVPGEEFPAIRRIYELYGKTDNIENVAVDAQHNYNRESREAVYRFFAKHILHVEDKSRFVEPEAVIEKLQDMLVFYGRALPEGALSFEQLFAYWRNSATLRVEMQSDLAALREQMAFTIGAEWPKDVQTQVNGTSIILSRAGKGDRVPGIWIPGRGSAALVVHSGGAELARNASVTRELIKSGRPVLLIEAFQTGSAIARRDRSHPFFLTFNRSDDANRVQDILTALAFLHNGGNDRIELIGLENAEVWCLFAAAIAPVELKFAPAPANFRGEDSDYLDRFFVPGIQSSGGLKAALRLVRGKK